MNSCDSTLQSHGKVYGMDAFSWHNPNILVLDRTIESFPFRTIWLGNVSEINQYIGSGDSNQKRIEKYLIYGECEDIVKKQINTTHFQTLNQSLQNLESYSFTPGILLFTASDSDSPFSIDQFSSFLSKLQ